MANSINSLVLSYTCIFLTGCIIQPLYKKADSHMSEVSQKNAINLEIQCSKIPLKVCSRFKSQLAYKMNSTHIKQLQKLHITLTFTTGDIAISDKATTFRKQSQLKAEGYSRWNKNLTGSQYHSYDIPIGITKVSSFGVDPQMEWASHMAEESRLMMLVDPLVNQIIQNLNMKRDLVQRN